MGDVLLRPRPTSLERGSLDTVPEGRLSLNKLYTVHAAERSFRWESRILG